jgi:hypothetical protein
MTFVSNNIASIYKYMSKFENIAQYLTYFAFYKPWLNGVDGKLYVINAYL